MNLCKSNLHTILSIQMAKPVAPEPTRHYYGVQGVMTVTITGQLKLLTDLFRGDDTEPFPAGNPLVPLSIIRAMKIRIPAALRPYDEDRIAEADKATPAG